MLGLGRLLLLSLLVVFRSGDGGGLSLCSRSEFSLVSGGWGGGSGGYWWGVGLRLSGSCGGAGGDGCYVADHFLGYGMLVRDQLEVGCECHILWIW